MRARRLSVQIDFRRVKLLASVFQDSASEPRLGQQTLAAIRGVNGEPCICLAEDHAWISFKTGARLFIGDLLAFWRLPALQLPVA